MRPPVAPALPGDQFVGWDLRPAGPLDGLEYRSGPIDATLHGRKQPDIDFLVALDIVAHAAGSIEVNGLKRTHERPPQCEPVANADIDVFDSAHAVGDQAERLLEKRALHPIYDEAVDFAVHTHRRLADGGHEGTRPFEGLSGRPLRGNDLDCRNETRRVDRMDHDASRPTGHLLHEGGGNQGRG